MHTSVHATLTDRETCGSSNHGDRVLEVRQWWGDLLLDTRHFPPSAREVRVGSRVAWRWQVLGVDMGRVPAALSRVLPWMAPMWSEVDPTPADDFLVGDGLRSDSERLAHHDGEGWSIAAADGWIADVASLLGSGRAERRDGGLRLRVDEEPVRLAIGPLVFEVREVPAARRVERAADLPDPGFLATLSVLAFCGLMLGVVTAFAPRPPGIEVQDIPDHWLQLAVHVPQPPPPERRSTAQRNHSDSHAPAPTGEGSRRRTRERAGEAQQESDMTVVRQAGILGSGALDGLLADGRVDDALIAGVGRLSAKAGGGPGVGLEGRSLGWNGVDGIGIGRIGGPGGGGPGGGGPGGDGLGIKQEGTLLAASTPVTVGAMDPMLVDEVIRRHLQALRYCYQRELQKDPSLDGKVTVRFVIAADGSVSSSEIKYSDLGSPAVESCLTSRFLRMRFPEPTGGGIVLVSYPLVFSRG